MFVSTAFVLMMAIAGLALFYGGTVRKRCTGNDDTMFFNICHWVWGGGFLGEDDLLDFVDGAAIHINSSIASLVSALVIDKRFGYVTTNMAPHNLTLSIIGVTLLWIGWFGFNVGSVSAANSLATIAFLNTQITSAAIALIKPAFGRFLRLQTIKSAWLMRL